MGQFLMEKPGLPGSALSGNQQIELQEFLEIRHAAQHGRYMRHDGLGWGFSERRNS